MYAHSGYSRELTGYERGLVRHEAEVEGQRWATRIATLFPTRIGDYTVPDDFLDEGRRCVRGEDLEDLTAVELFGEQQRLRRAIGISTGAHMYIHDGTCDPPKADEWLRWRLRVVSDELARRRTRRSA